MKDIEVHLEKLHVQIAECEMIRDLATEPKKRELFGRLAEHFRILAADLERALPGHHDGAFTRLRSRFPKTFDARRRAGF